MELVGILNLQFFYLEYRGHLILLLVKSFDSLTPSKIESPIISVVPFFHWSEFKTGTFSFTSCYAAYALSHSPDS